MKNSKKVFSKNFRFPFYLGLLIKREETAATKQKQSIPHGRTRGSDLHWNACMAQKKGIIKEPTSVKPEE